MDFCVVRRYRPQRTFHARVMMSSPNPFFDLKLLPVLCLPALLLLVGCSDTPSDPAASNLPDVAAEPDSGRVERDATADGNASDVPDSTAIGGDTEPADVDPSDVAPDVTVPTDAGQPDAPADNYIRIATWNVERMFDMVCDSSSCTADSFEAVYSSAQYNYKIARVAAGLARMQADVVLLQEIEKQSCLQDIARQATTLGYNVQLIGETGGTASLDTAILARGDVLLQRDHADVRIPRPGGGTTSFSREFMEVHLLVEGTRVIVFNAHFKSQNNDDPERRLAEARAANDIVEGVIQEYPDAVIVLGGDLNDVPGSDAINAVESGGFLDRVARELVPNDGTVTFNGRENALDHLYFCNRCGGSYVPGSATIFGDGSGGLEGSDHRALRADFTP